MSAPTTNLHTQSDDTPAFYFLGVTTGQSSMMQIFPRWMADLGRDVRLVGVDLPIHAAPERYRALVETIKRVTEKFRKIAENLGRRVWPELRTCNSRFAQSGYATNWFKSRYGFRSFGGALCF